MNLSEIFKAGGVACAHIVDDAYDAIPIWRLKDRDIQEFIDSAEDEDLEAVSDVIGVVCDENAIRNGLKDEGSFGKIYLANLNLTDDARAALFKDFEDYRDSKRDLLKPLFKLLRDEGVKCVEFGVDYDPKEEVAPQLLFVDLKLKENEAVVDHRDAVAIVSRLRAAHHNCKPFVFLMSSLDTMLPELREPFRDEAELFQSEFEAIRKDAFNDTEALTLILAANTRAMPQAAKLRESMNHLQASLVAANKTVMRQLRALDLADYFALYHNTVDVEKTTVGSYMVELLLEFVAHEVEGSDAIWEMYKGIEDLNVQKLPRARFGITSPAARLYSANMLHSNQRLFAEESLKKGPRDGYFYLGDIFCDAQWMNAPFPARAYVVISPACDLVRPASMVENILLCEGEVTEFFPGEIPNIRDALPVVVMPSPRVGGKDILITWDRKSIRTWDSAERKKFSSENCSTVRIGRLRPVFALQLQHAVTSSLNRVGTQRPPSILAPRQVRCYICDGKRWQLLYKSNSKDAGAIADLVTDDGSFVTYILSDPTVHDILKALAAWVQQNPMADKTDGLKLLAGDDVVNALQGFRQKVPKPDRNKHDETAYPFDKDKLVAFIYGRSAVSPFSGLRNGNKFKNNHDTRLVVVFDDDPDVVEPADGDRNASGPDASKAQQLGATDAAPTRGQPDGPAEDPALSSEASAARQLGATSAISTPSQTDAQAEPKH
ncbi:hypothetical protein [Burkholderia gladioli]|uniref:hypothetical protein n=1 Tax=Burkholderia gladioli TaxID=28095 RepID=UPI001C2315C7|nr:hypothetical protein [Burkholderia gladioli]MBU9169587.1 hypothetical protein [Burkholderia gladioli]